MTHTPIPWIPEGDWHKYEAYIFGSLQRRFSGPNARVVPNIHLLGIKSGRQRQIDILVEINVGGSCLKIAFDCKCYKRKVNVNDVERFLGMLDDVRVSKGVLVTTKGYSKTALKRAQQDARDIDLQIVPPERLSDYQFIGDVWFWKGSVLAILSTPDGWVVDNEDTRKPGGCQFSMYPLGHTLESAKRACPFLYGNIVLKDEFEPTMEAIAERHERDTKKVFPDARFERLPSPFPTKEDEPSRILFRVGHIDKSYGGPEYSLYIDSPKGALLLVLLCFEGTETIYVPALKWIGGGALLSTRDEEFKPPPQQ